MANWSGIWTSTTIRDAGTPVDYGPGTLYTAIGYVSTLKWYSASIYGTGYSDIIQLDKQGYSTARLAGPWYFSLGGGNDVLDLTSKRFYYGGVEAHGGSGNDWLLGNYGSDQLWGDSGNDVLKGYGGADYLNGGTGADAMYGGRGNDTYVVDNYGDRVFEYANEGYDTVRVYNINYTLGYSQEALELKGTYNINGVGNTKDNVITGNEGYNRLTGGGGNDTFVFNTALKSWNWDTITDFGHSSDTIKLENAVFTGLSAGWLASIAFKDVTLGAVDRTDRIIYNFNTGDLYFDRDGSGTAYRAVKFAHVTPGTFLDASDFYVF